MNPYVKLCYISLPVSPSHFRTRKVYAPVNLDRIQHWIDQGRLTSSPEKPITAKELLLSGCIHQVHDGIKLLGSVSLLSHFLCINVLTQLLRVPST